MSDQRNWLERLREKIPGYAGYAARERRRDQDKAHREHLADRLRAARQPLAEAVRELSSTGRLLEVGVPERVSKKLDQAENRLRFASYGYSGLFDAVKVDEPQLDALYRFDLALAEAVEEIERRARALGAHLGTAAELKQAATELEQAVDQLNRTFDERTRAVEGASGGEAAPEGQPMFGS